MSQDIYVVFESTDALIVNCFTSLTEAKEWVDSDRMGETVLGPFTLDTSKPIPFEVVFEVTKLPFTVENIYLEDTLEQSNMQSQYTYLGSYTVYESIEQFEDNISE